MPRYIVNSQRATLADDQPKQAVAPRNRADCGSLIGGDPTRYEQLYEAVRPQDAQGGILGVQKISDAVDDQLQYAVGSEDAGDATDGLIERFQPPIGGVRLGASCRQGVVDIFGSGLGRHYGPKR